MKTRQEILSQFPERDLEGVWEISPDADSRWRAAMLELLLDIRDMLAAASAANRPPAP